jgi:hypothetical protein
MQQIAIYYGVVAWLGCLLTDLVVIVARGPVLIDPIVKLVIVLLCLLAVLFPLSRRGWLLRE